MSLNLLPFACRWKEGLLELRQMVAELQAQGYTDEALRPFKQHWDHQLYKALEYQYRMGLESLHELLPEIKVFMRPQP